MTTPWTTADVAFRKVTFHDPDAAFADAIASGRLSDFDGLATTNYAGDFMYMGTRAGRDLFKNIDTRVYLP